jgi:hypothetical protein
MLRAVSGLFERWGLRGAECRLLLGSPSERTFQRLRAGDVASISHDTVFRHGCLLGTDDCPLRGGGLRRSPPYAAMGR